MDEADRLKLHHGPYAAPACRRGRPRKAPVPGSPPLEAIRRALRDDGRSYPEIAEAAGVGLATVSRVMTAAHDPPLSTVAAILEALGRPFATLDEKTPAPPGRPGAGVGSD